MGRANGQSVGRINSLIRSKLALNISRNQFQITHLTPEKRLTSKEPLRDAGVKNHDMGTKISERSEWQNVAENSRKFQSDS